MNSFIVVICSIVTTAFSALLLKVGGAKKPPGFRGWYLIHGIVFVISGLVILAGLAIWILVQFLRTLT